MLELDIVQALQANHPVVFGTGVDKAFEDYSGEDIVISSPTNILGYHALCIEGYRRNPKVEFLITNSWGPGWGKKGSAWLTSNYVTDALISSDFWVPTLMPDLLT
jgi:C1A family cysteine protease